MLMRVVQSVLVAFFVFLFCIFVGGVILPLLKWEVSTAVGSFLVTWATALAVAAGLWHFVSGGTLWKVG